MTNSSSRSTELGDAGSGRLTRAATPIDPLPPMPHPEPPHDPNSDPDAPGRGVEETEDPIPEPNEPA